MAVSVRRLGDGTTIIKVDGVGKVDVLRHVLDMVEESTGASPVVLDVDDLLLLDTAGVRMLAGYLDAEHDRVRVVSSRLSARRVLRRFSVGSLDVFPSVERALRPFST